MDGSTVRHDRAQPGQVLVGKYMVERVLATGGMGVVVAARHLTLQQRVAIKLIRPELATDQVTLQRFIREAQAAARLRTDHVARVLDVGSFEDGLPYMVMEYLDGEDLGRVLRKLGRLPVGDAVTYLLQVCTALAEAHANGIIHRDLKPSNLFLAARPDGAPLVKVLDFGISKMNATVRDVEDARLTKSRTTVGSPGYMAPEQLTGHDIDARADIWALGVILFELVTGRQPFEAPSYAEVSIKVLRDPAPVLSDHLPGVPGGLSHAVGRCLSRRADDRFPDVAALAAALSSYADGGARTLVERVASLLASSTRSFSRRELGVATSSRRASVRWLGAGLVAAAGVLVALTARTPRPTIRPATAHAETAPAAAPSVAAPAVAPPAPTGPAPSTPASSPVVPNRARGATAARETSTAGARSTASKPRRTRKAAADRGKPARAEDLLRSRY